MAANSPLDTTIAVVTPENIAFEYQLAGPFRRLPAYLIDIAVRWAIVFVFAVICMLMAGLFSMFSSIVGASTVGIAIVFYFLVTWFYGTIMEAYYNGRTIGKWACGIRVIDVEGRPISGRSALLRNLLRTADLAPVAFYTISDDLPPVPLICTGMIALISMVCTKRMQRLGDLAAGTMVIIDERAWRLPVAKVDDPRVPALASYVPGDYRVSRTMSHTLATYAERRHYLTPARRREIARHLTDPLIDRFEFRSDIDPDLLLYALYYKTFLAESSVEEPDLGPLRGYSPLARDANKVKNAESPLAGGITTAKPVVPLGYAANQTAPASAVPQAANAQASSSPTANPPPANPPPANPPPTGSRVGSNIEPPPRVQPKPDVDTLPKITPHDGRSGNNENDKSGNEPDGGVF